jgi:hypothetical protein
VRTNYVLIDYENVKPESLAGLDAEHFRVLMFVGAGQNKLAFDVAAAMQGLGARAQYVRIAGNGPNALDFHIAYYIGHYSHGDPSAFFHFISKDKGFDPLIQHLEARKVFAARCGAIEEIPLLKTAGSKSLAQRAEAVVADLRKRGASTPRTIRSLSSTIHALFRKQLSDNELAELLAALQEQGVVTVDGAKITYTLPDADS